jgi:hypothetical protein
VRFLFLVGHDIAILFSYNIAASVPYSLTF